MVLPIPRTVGLPAWRVPSRSQPGQTHTVARTIGGGLRCSCTAGSFGRQCAHVRAVADLVAAEPLRFVTGEPPMANDHAVAPITATAPTEVSWETMEVVLGSGDLAKLTARQKVEYYRSTCESLGLNWRTMPFRFITFPQSGTQLYAQRGAADQLRRVNGVTIVSLETEVRGDHYIVTARARDRQGREDVDLGVVSIKGLGGLELANAMKRAITQAKRRVTLSICGLAFLDETETPDVPRAALLEVDIDTGEVLGEAPPVAPSATMSAHEISGKREPVTNITGSPERKRLNQQLLAAMADRNMRQSDVTKIIADCFGATRTSDLTDQQVSDVTAWVLDAKELRYDAAGQATLVDAGGTEATGDVSEGEE